MGLLTLAVLHHPCRTGILRKLALSNAQLGESDVEFLLGERATQLPCFRDDGLWALRHLALGSLRLSCQMVRGLVTAMPRLETLELTRMPLIEAAPSEEQHEML